MAVASQAIAQKTSSTLRSKSNGRSVDITRCVCGRDEDQYNSDDSPIDALFVQCDSCYVWQHGPCVGLRTMRDIPELYFCELCRPDLHSIVQRGRQAFKQTRYHRGGLHNSNSKKREQIDASSNLKENLRRDQQTKSKTGTVDAQSTNEADIHKKLRLRTQRNISSSSIEDSPRNKIENRSSKPIPSANSSEKTLSPKSDEDEFANILPDQIIDSTNTNSESNGSLNSSKPNTNTNNKSPPRGDQHSEPAKKSRRVVSSVASVGTSMTNDSRKNNGHSVSNGKSYINNNNDESSPLPPARPKLPQSRTTISDMRRRISLILDYVERIQVDLAMEREARVEFFKACKREQPEAFRKDECIALLAQLTHKLISWESKFGVKSV